MANTMKRWVTDELGRQNLRLVEEPVPTPGPGQILVKVGAVSLNFRDIMCLDKGLGFPGKNFTPASDMAGAVVAVGANVTAFKAGDRVISCPLTDWLDGEPTPKVAHLGGEHPGVLAEYVVLNEDWAVHAPAGLSDAEAAAIPCAGLTAWFALVEKGHLFAGQTVLVHGTGGVALWGLQIALAHGATTLVVSRDDAKLARAKALGAHHGINRTTGDWVEAARAATGGRGVNHILETIGGPHLGRSLEAVAEGGRVSMIGLFEGIDFSGKFPHLIRKHAKIEGIGVGHRRGLEDMVRAIDANQIKPVVDAEFPFSDVLGAFGRLGQGAFGKVVLTL